MNFGKAIELLKENRKVARNGWNGKGMYLWLYKGVYSLEKDEKVQKNGLGIMGDNNAPSDFFKIPVQPFILMKTADETFVPWLASQTDILAEDWEEIKGLTNSYL